MVLLLTNTSVIFFKNLPSEIQLQGENKLKKNTAKTSESLQVFLGVGREQPQMKNEVSHCKCLEQDISILSSEI